MHRAMMICLFMQARCGIAFSADGIGTEMWWKYGIFLIMNEIDLGAFSALFKEACVRCFGHAVREPLTETDAKLFYTKVFEATGLVIGAKSIKNYSAFLFGGWKTENP